MVYEVVITILTIIVLAVASFTDLKKREVPDLVSYGFLFGALGLRFLFSIKLGWQFLVSGLVGFVIFFAISLLFYYTGQWGGADSKLLMGIGAVIGADFILGANSWDLPLFLILLLLIGAVWGLLFTGSVIVLKFSSFYPALKTNLQKNSKIHTIAGSFSLVFLIMSIFSPLLILLAIFPLFSYYLFISLSSAQESIFTRQIAPSQAVDGDWLFKDVVVKRKNILKKKVLERDDLKILIALEAEGSLKTITIKEGIPLVPGFLFAYLIIAFGQSILEKLVALIF